MIAFFVSIRITCLINHRIIWDYGIQKSLAAVAAIANLAVKSFETEPLAKPDWYQSVIENHYLVDLAAAAVSPLGLRQEIWPVRARKCQYD